MDNSIALMKSQEAKLNSLLYAHRGRVCNIKAAMVIEHLILIQVVYNTHF